MKANLLKSMSREAQEEFDNKLNQAAEPHGFFGRAMIDEKSVLGESDFLKYQRIGKILAAREEMLAKRKNLILNFLGFFN